MLTTQLYFAHEPQNPKTPKPQNPVARLPNYNKYV